MDKPIVSPEEVVEAYRETGLGVMRQGHISGHGDRACGLIALAIHHGADKTPVDAAKCLDTLLQERVGSGYPQYISGFEHGFDDVNIAFESTPLSRQGRDEGQAVWNAVLRAIGWKYA